MFRSRHSRMKNNESWSLNCELYIAGGTSRNKLEWKFKFSSMVTCIFFSIMNGNLVLEMEH